jgi:F-type H+-transporting ATPase subunit b
MLASNALIQVTPGLMIWTIVAFFITFFVLKKYAIEEADHARDEARNLLEEHKRLMQEARGEAEGIIAEARKTRDSIETRMREETEAERQRRLEETRREIQAETTRQLERIRSEVADLTLEATSIVVGRKLDADRDRELITEAIGSLDFSRLEDSK